MRGERHCGTVRYPSQVLSDRVGVRRQVGCFAECLKLIWSAALVTEPG